MKLKYHLSWYIRYPLIGFFVFFPLIFATNIKNSMDNRFLWIITVLLGSAWVVVFAFRNSVEFNEDRVTIQGSLMAKEVLYKDITKLTVLNFDNYPLIPFYFRVYYKNEKNQERFFEIQSKEFAENSFKIFDEFKKRGFDIVKLNEL